ncbi:MULTISPECIES: RecE family exodeoxyribonuclease [Enterobacter]|jgi:exodeoxyribonuclease VIII|uniref:Exodeoxyribonuclease n=1 Tax=Enterobacter bugandensis TaxID=881260 RepID=A0ABX4VQJ6_9ENTR|nr:MULTISPECIES: RecE family exodeoxyribonuclease [Enterobacter]MBZ6366464.1 PD-(D/E)XK nuclease-like domain-containing protein [Enterobacter bugandensis]MCM7429052.1 PD-(D/E)XK nuclease-like domain-containing protein [Enterobacter bugandensis]NUX24534.1 PD-(D/E)XK nuclease-like domain-containing protein [Enterobacter bugandensis]NUX47395.1 PD-(D/E)XK nuclease-like domain-containing protein [Enterobacter bugandensis]NUX68350.1 PD-(D/E)XK nuclease-like domain-containing protein [Enterobacter bu
MEFFYVVKATQKSGKEDAVIWFTAKSEARANLQLDVELEDACIETGRGKDYAKPVRTDFPVYNDLPEESTVDYTWCKRYELQDDGRTWLPKAGAQSTGDVDSTAAPETTIKVETSVESVPLENRTPAVRFAVHLASDKYQSHITKEQQLAASEMSLDEGNTYLQNLLLAKNDIPEIAELSLNAEWKLVQAIKQVFAQDETHEAEVIAAFMADWARADVSDRNQLIEEWRSGKLSLLKSESTSDTDVTAVQVPEPENGIQIDENDDETTRYPVVRMPFRKQLLAQFTADELRHHLTREEYEGICALEMDTDNSYVQNLLLAAENCEVVKGYDTKDLWRYTDAIRKVFSQEKRHELALVLRFTRIWAATDYIDRGTLVREWTDGNRISEVGSPAPLKPAKPETTESYKRAVAQNMANLSIEIAIALLYPDAVPGQINRTQLLAAKELADKKDESHTKALKVLGKTNDILDYDANSIFGVTRAISWSGEESTTELRSQVREWFTANGIYENGERSKGYPEWSEDSRAVRHSTVEEPSTPSQPKVASLGSGVFSIDGLMLGNTAPVIDIPSNEVEKTENTAETTSDVQMETTQPEKVENTDPVQPGEGADAANTQAVTVAPEEQQSEPVIEYPAYFEPGRYEGLPNEVYHAANGISSTQVKDARVSLMYFNARHVAKTIPRTASKVLDMGNLVHALALQPENLEAEFSVEPEIPEGAFTTTVTLREFIDAYNASLPAQLSADDIKALLEEHNASLPAPVPPGASLEETAQSYMALPAEYQRIEEGQKQTATAMKACIKEYNATLPVPVKTSGSRDALLEQLAIINPDLVAQEAQKPTPLKVSGTKADMIQAVKSVKPDAVFVDELLDAWRDNPGEKILVTRQQLATARAIQSALLAHPTAGMLLTHPSRAVEVSYFGFDDETGLEVRVRPDLEIELDGVRIGADLKTISMWNVKQESLRARLHREIIDRDYHLSAAMYCETAALDQFFWIFVNKDENYHWIAIIEASTELLELGMLEYRKTMRAIATGFDTGEWPAPITTDYTDELNDFDLRRLEALRAQA